MNTSIIVSLFTIFTTYLIQFFASGWFVFAVTLLSLVFVIRVIYTSLETKPEKPHLYLVK